MLVVIRGTLLSEGATCCMTEADWVRRIRNKAKLRPIELVDPRNSDLRRVLQKAEMAMTAGDDVVNEDEEDSEGPGSESD